MKLKLKGFLFAALSFAAVICLSLAAGLFAFAEVDKEIYGQAAALFADYAQTQLAEGVDKAYLDELRARAEAADGYEEVKPLLDRAEEVLSGALKKQLNREYSTADGTIAQNGNTSKYAKEKLLLQGAFTGIQPLGIYASAGQRVNVFVKADEGALLPEMVFTGTAEGQTDFTVQTLEKGVNSFTAYGGAVYIVNPHTDETQKGEVTLYIEGGENYPVFRSGDSEEALKAYLKDYCERLASAADGTVTANMFEAVGNNVIITAKATLAEKFYVGQENSVRKNLDDWDKYIRAMLEFDGVSFDEKAAHYNPLNGLLKVNIRQVTEGGEGGVYATENFIAVADGPFAENLLVKQNVNHEFAVALGAYTANGGVSAAYSALYDGYEDLRTSVEAYSRAMATSSGIIEDANSFAQFYILEGAEPGFWAKLENAFRYELSGTELSPAEKTVYYSSLALGVDLRSYFERWHSRADGEFSYENASEEFKLLFEKAATDGKIKTDDRKLWYTDDKQFSLIAQNGGLKADWAACYGEKQTVKVREVNAYDGGYTLFLPAPSKPKAHLLYEVQSYINNVWQVIGITYGIYFEDNFDYGNSTPQYRVYAYDRMLNCTGTPQTAKPSQRPQTEVCRVGNTKYFSLKQALFEAPGGSCVYLLTSFSDGGILINKSVKIMPAPEVSGSITITKNCAGALFTVTQEFTLGDAAGAQLVLDGNGFAQRGSLIEIKGETAVNCTLYNTVLRNNINQDNGGAVAAAGGARLRMFDCTVQSNTAENGGGLYLGATGGNARAALRTELYGVTVKGNTAKKNGGGICIDGSAGLFNSKATEYSYGITVSGNTAEKGGGIYSQGNVNVTALNLKENKAELGGGAYIKGGKFYIVSAAVSGNTAQDKTGAILLDGGTLNINGGSFGGDIYKGEFTSINLENNLPDFTGAQFVLPEITQFGVVLIDGLNGIPDDQITTGIIYVKTLNVLYGEARLEGNRIYVNKKLAKITVKYGEESFDASIYCGEFALPDRLDGVEEDKYIYKWVIDGKDYLSGATYSLNGDCTVEISLREYFNVTLIYGVKSYKLNVKQFEEYLLPAKSPDGGAVFGWECSDGNNYSCSQSIEVNYNVVFTAVIKPVNRVILSVEGVNTQVLCGYGSTYILPEPAAVLGKKFTCWQIGEERHFAGEGITVKEDLTFVAQFASEEMHGEIKISVITLNADGENTREYYCEKGFAFMLPLPENVGAHCFCYWLVDGVRREAGEVITAEEQMTIVAAYGDGHEITVTQFNGETDFSQTLIFGEGRKFVLPRPAAVPEGKVFVCWLVNGKAMQPDDGVTVDGRLNITAQYRELKTFTVTATVKKGEAPVTESVTEGGTFILPNPLKGSIWGDKFHYWDVNGIRYAAGAKLTVLEDTQITAVYAAFYKVTVTLYINGKIEKQESYVAEGDYFKLPEASAPPEGLTFKGWEAGGRQYSAGERIYVTGNTEVKAVYVDEKGQPEEKSNKTLYIIIGAVVVAVAAAGGAAWYLYNKKKKK